MEGLAGAVLGETLTHMREDEDRRATEKRLVRDAQNGDLVAFERLYRDNERKVFALCLRMSSDGALAEELTQEVFVRAWRKLGSFRGDSAFSSWLYPLTVNVALSERRSRRRRDARIFATDDPASLERAPGSPRPEAGFDLEKAMAALPPGARAIFVLHDVEGRTHDEIAALSEPRDRDVEGAALPRPETAQGGTRIMTCHELDERLDDWVDGALPAAAASEVEAHLLSCALCRERERRLRHVLAHAAALPRSLTPPRDLWPGIAQRVTRERSWSWAAGGSRPWALAAAATVVVGLGAVLWNGPSPSRVRTVQIPAPSPETMLVAGTAVVSDPVLAAAERDYEAAANALLEALQQRRARLQPEALAAVETNLQVIDRALAEVRLALVQDPANPELSRMLVSTHRKKVEVLSRVVKLSTVL